MIATAPFFAAQNSADRLLDRVYFQAEKSPARDAIVTPDFKLSYAGFAQLLKGQICRFEELGITESAVVGIQCADEVKHLLLCLAVTHCGATSCTIPTYESTDIQEAVKQNCGVTHVVDENTAVNPETSQASFESDISQSGLVDARLLFSTSGTTGNPKLVLHHDRDLVAQAHRHVGSEFERFACVASIEQNFAKRHRLYCVAIGATNVFPGAGLQSLVAHCRQLDVNVLHISAFQAQELLTLPDISSLSAIRLKLGGSHVPLLLRKQLRSHITQNFQAGYGTTETGAIAFTDSDDINAGESVGQPLPGIEVRVVSKDRQPLAIGMRGELAIRCEGMFRGYVGNRQLTDSRLVDDWFYTGDIGYLDKQQRIHLCGRSDDMFLFNSMNIYPQEIESIIRQYPNIIDVAVLPRKSSAHDNIPVALIVFEKNTRPVVSELKKFVQKKAGIRSPRQYTVVDQIPRNTTGKIARNDAMDLSLQHEQIRQSIVQVLASTGAAEHLDKSLIEAFKAGDRDIRISDIALDSLARMELLIALELNHDTIIMPYEFSQFKSLAEIVSRAVNRSYQNQSGRSNNKLPAELNVTTADNASQLYTVRFFQRIFKSCRTATHLGNALTTLEARLTPIEFAALYDLYLADSLLPCDAADKFRRVVSRWFDNFYHMMSASGKSTPEPYQKHRINGAVTLFTGPTDTINKTLVICFAMRGGRQLMMPNAVLMQHTDSIRYDLLVISEPMNENYYYGIPGIGNNLAEIIDWLGRLELLNQYNHIRTMGCSAGGYTAILAGHVLGAELALSIAGRFSSKGKHPIRFLSMIFLIWRVMRQSRCQQVIASYAADKSRDRKFANIIARLFKGRRNEIEVADEKLGHSFFRRLVERGELSGYLSGTIFLNNGVDSA